MNPFLRRAAVVLVVALVSLGTLTWACDAHKALAEGGKEKCAIQAARFAELLKGAEEVELVGRVLCTSCDLKAEGKHCNLVFRVAGDTETIYTIVKNDKLAELAQVTSHGEKVVTVTGKAVSEKDLHLLSIENFHVKG